MPATYPIKDTNEKIPHKYQKCCQAQLQLANFNPTEGKAELSFDTKKSSHPPIRKSIKEAT